jgi:RNA 2',3'-cyclic 3'-phosphodiesterase
MRLFIVTEEIHSEELERIKKEFDVKGIRAVGCFHLTFKFLGDVKEDLIEGIKVRLNKIEFNRFKIRLKDLGVFPDEDFIKVIWVGLEGDEANKLQKEIDEKLKDMFDEEDRFKTHITIGRVKFLENKEEIRKKLKMNVREEEFEIEKFILYGSELTKEGPKYEKLAEFNLKQ